MTILISTFYWTFYFISVFSLNFFYSVSHQSHSLLTAVTPIYLFTFFSPFPLCALRSPMQCLSILKLIASQTIPFKAYYNTADSHDIKHIVFVSNPHNPKWAFLTRIMENKLHILRLFLLRSLT